MEKDQKDLRNYKLEYLKLIYKITNYRLSGKVPPDNLLKQAKEVGRLAEIVEDELTNL